MSAPHHNSTYSYRGKLGLIVPPTNTVNEAEWARMLPEGVTFHTHRMPLHSDTSSEAGKKALLDDLQRVITLIAEAKVDTVAYACTAGSMINPADSLPRELSRRTGVATVTTSAAIVSALQAFGARRISVATPYAEALNEHETAFLEENGFAVDRLVGLGIGARGPSEYPLIAQTPIRKVAEHARDAFVSGGDALLITCTDFPTLPILTELEAEIGVPVVTSNQATLWAALRTAGLADRLDGAGSLLRLH